MLAVIPTLRRLTRIRSFRIPKYSGQVSKRAFVASMTTSDDIAKFQEIVQRSKHIVVIAGAGLSAASGEAIFLYRRG